MLKENALPPMRRPYLLVVVEDAPVLRDSYGVALSRSCFTAHACEGRFEALPDLERERSGLINHCENASEIHANLSRATMLSTTGSSGLDLTC